ncbi:MAG: hypothetical protein AAFV53_33380, partial [Myxococcota bacterium]
AVAAVLDAAVGGLHLEADEVEPCGQVWHRDGRSGVVAGFDLVRFEMKSPDGSVQNRSNRLEAPSDAQWEIPPRGMREVLLEMPSSGALKPGRYELAVHLDLEPSDITIGPATLQIVSPQPVAADLRLPALHGERTQDTVLWLHKGADGYDLYLIDGIVQKPGAYRGQYHLARLSDAVSPMLTATRSADNRSRFLVWMHDDRTLGYARLQDHRLRTPPQRLSVAWPRITLAARGMTAPDGALYQPIWIPAPRGDAGELQMMVLSAAGRPTYRRIGRYNAQPGIIRSMIDDSGSMHVLVVNDGAIDIHTVRSGDTAGAEKGLPIGGRRMLASTPDQPLVDARFGLLNADGDNPGGLSLVILQRTADGAAVTPRWLSLAGRELKTLPPIPLSPDDTIVDMIPAPSGTVGVLARSPQGRARFIEDGRYQNLSRLAEDVALDRDSQGKPFLRSLEKPASAQNLAPKTALPAN